MTGVRPTPWRIGHALVLELSAVIGLALLAGAWWGSTETARPERQAGWLSLGLLGVAVSVTGAGLWLLAGRQAVGSRRRRVAVRLDAGPSTASVGPLLSRVERPVASALMDHYHRSGCLLVAGRAVDPAARADHHGAGRIPCGVCRPDGDALETERAS